MSSATVERSLASPLKSAAMRSMARRTSGGGMPSPAVGNRCSIRARVCCSSASGSCRPAMPRSPQATPHRPIAVSKSAKPWAVMLSPLRRYGDTGNFRVDRAQVVAARKIEGLPVVAAEGDIGCGGGAVYDAADLHAVWNAGLVAAQIGKDPVGVLGERAIGQQLEGANVAAARVVDVEDIFIGRKGEAIGQHEVADQQGHRAEVGRDAVDAGKGQVPLLGCGRAGPRIGEIDAA